MENDHFHSSMIFLLFYQTEPRSIFILLKNLSETSFTTSLRQILVQEATYMCRSAVRQTKKRYETSSCRLLVDYLDIYMSKAKFSKELDVNGIVWENFDLAHQVEEINNIWSNTKYAPTN